MPRLRARRFREALRLHPEIELGWEAMYELVLAETESKDVAERVARDYLASVLRSGRTPH